MEQEIPYKSVALIVGVTSMVGLNLAQTLKSPKAVGGPWKVYATSRRPKPPHIHSSTIDHYITLDATDYNDTMQKLSSLSSKITHLFWLAIKFQLNEEENITTNSAMLKNVVDVLFHSTSSLSRLRHVSLLTGTKNYMGPVEDPSLINKLIPHDPPFCEAMPRLPYQNFYYALEDLLTSYSSYFSYTVHRASIILGPSFQGFCNVPLTLFVYTTICKYEGSKLRYPGTLYTWEHFCDMSDSEILADQQLWAATTYKAKNQAFNCTNGDVFTWKRVWKELCAVFGLEFVPFDENEKFNLVKEMEGKGEVWEAIVEQFGLQNTKLTEITNFAALDIVLHFQIQHVCSMNKSREFGFSGYKDTMKSIRKWVENFQEMKVIP